MHGSGKHAPRGGHGSREQQVGHVSVLLKEAIEFLAVKPGGTYIDATVGLGGHSFELARRLGPRGRLIGLDKDPKALAIARERLQPPAGMENNWPVVELINASFARVAEFVGENEADGLLADLGLSSLQLADAARGFSFQAEGALDMRMDPGAPMTAEQAVNQLSERELADLIYEFGEERRSRRIARAIVRSRPIRTSKQLAEVVAGAAGPMKPGRIHPATQTFQALRIFVNRELDDLRALLLSAPGVLRQGGRLVMISFHSLEDRIVKDAFRDGAQAGCYRLLTKKPVTASEEEVERNPRSRSAKLRAVEKVVENVQNIAPRHN
ncbi:MAG: 16S rRNA (cytosine(1402)-N(4))-methyltransferase RsmH [Terriglobales bacterium]